jgi:Pro-kumamolisin, activation domain
MSLRTKSLLLAAIASVAATVAACASDTPDERAASSAQPILVQTLDTFAVYAERYLVVGQFATVLGGGVGVASIAETGTKSQLIVGPDVEIAPLKVSFAPSVTLGPGSVIGALDANAVKNLGAASVGTISPYVIPTMPPIALGRPLSATGGADVTVAAGQTTTLPPGSYGALEVGGTVNLTLGAYSFTSVDVASGANFFASPSTGCSIYVRCITQVQIAGSLSVGARARFQAYSGSLADQASASGLEVTVSGSNDGSTPVASIGANAFVDALLAAPAGSLVFGDTVVAFGAFSAFDVVIGLHTHINFDTGFPAQPQGTQQLSGYYGASPYAVVAPVIGPAPPTAVMTLDIGLPTRVHEDRTLANTVKLVSDPLKNPATYRQYMTQAEFAAAFGADPVEFGKVVSWATSSGLTIDHTFPTNLLLSVSGTVAQVEQALHANLVLRARPDGTPFVTVDRDPSVDLEPQLLWIGGLDDFLPPMPSGGSVNGTGCQQTFTSSDLRTAYLDDTVPCTGSSCTCNPTVSLSPCESLTGEGQVVGVFTFVPHNTQDITSYDNSQTPLPITYHELPDVVIGSPASVVSGLMSSTETPMDIEMVQAMAPGATIVVFQELPFSNLFNLGHVDAAFHAMANNTPALTVATSSWQFGRDPNEQQALYQMAMQGVSFFAASGDYGNIEDPQDDRDLDDITLVGGTFLNTTASSTCSQQAYNGESTWNEGTSGADITGGGIMDGTQNLTNLPYPSTWISSVLLAAGLPEGALLDFGVCDCYPYPFCCGSPVPTPTYQAPLINGANQGSTQYRNYPDVSIVATNFSTFADGSCQENGGTSGAAPLWAGFMALTNQLSQRNGAKTIGFASPALYEIGATQGQAVNDLYSQDFHDIADGVENSVAGGGGYRSVTGYDLATGLGTPTCNLMYQLATTTPISGHTPLYWLDFVVTTGDDDLAQRSGLTADVTFHSGVKKQFILKSGAGVGGANQGPHWNNGSMVTIPFNLVEYLDANDIPSLDSGIDSITLTLVEAAGSDSGDFDNWSIAGFNVRLAANPGGDVQEACEFDLPGIYGLDGGHLGVARLSGTNGASGIGPKVTFATPAAAAALPPGAAYPFPYDTTKVGVTNCSATGHPVMPSGQDLQPAIQFIFSTGSDGLRGDSGLATYAFDKNGNQIDSWQLKDGDGSKWNPDSQQNQIYSLAGGVVPDHINMNVQQHDHGLQTDDNWNVNGINIMVWQPNGPEICYHKDYQSAGQAADGGGNGAVLKIKDNTVTFTVTNCSAIE